MEELNNIELQEAANLVNSEAVKKAGMNPVVGVILAIATVGVGIAAVVGGPKLIANHKEKHAFKPGNMNLEEDCDNADRADDEA